MKFLRLPRPSLSLSLQHGLRLALRVAAAVDAHRRYFWILVGLME